MGHMRDGEVSCTSYSQAKLEVAASRNRRGSVLTLAPAAATSSPGRYATSRSGFALNFKPSVTLNRMEWYSVKLVFQTEQYCVGWLARGGAGLSRLPSDTGAGLALKIRLTAWVQQRISSRTYPWLHRQVAQENGSEHKSASSQAPAL